MENLLDFCKAMLILNGALFVSVIWFIFWIALIIEVSDNIREGRARVRKENGEDNSLGE